MGLFQEYSTTAAARKPDLFTQAEKQHFQHVVEALRDMPYCSEADLCQAAKSYFYQSARAMPGRLICSERHTARRRLRESLNGGIKSTRHQGRLGRTPSTRRRKRQGGGKWP